MSYKDEVQKHGGVRKAAKANGVPYATFWDRVKKEAGAEVTRGPGRAKILLLDIETSPNVVYAWGLFKQNLSLDHIIEPGSTLCWAARWLGETDPPDFASVHKHGQEQMLRMIYIMLREADVVVHYNGSNFDIPTLNKEFLKCGWLPPKPFLEVDLLQSVRSRFRLTSNKLDFVAQFLGLGQKTKHKGMQLWKDCIDGDAVAWEVMEEYNKQDVVLLEDLYLCLLPWISNHPNLGLYGSDLERTGCPNCGASVEGVGNSYTRLMRYNLYKCTGCGAWSRDRHSNLKHAERKAIISGVK